MNLFNDFKYLLVIGGLIVFTVVVNASLNKSLDTRSQAAGDATWLEFKSSGFEQELVTEWDQVNQASGTFGRIAESTSIPPSNNPNSSYIAQAFQDGSPDTSVGHFSRSLWHLPEIGEGSYLKSTASYYLPVGFYDSMQGAVQLMGYDTFPALSNQYRLAIYNGDKLPYIFVMEDGVGRNILRGQSLPEGEWFTLSVETYLSNTDGWSKLYLNGNLMSESSADTGCEWLDNCGDTMPNAPITRIRYGLVAVANGIQTNPLTIWLDDASISFGELNNPSPLPSPVSSPTASPVASPIASPSPAPVSNNDPFFITNSVSKARVNRNTSFTITAADKDTKDVLSMKVIQADSWIGMNDCSSKINRKTKNVELKCNFSGVPTQKGTAQITLEVTDDAGGLVQKSYSFNVR